MNIDVDIIQKEPGLTYDKIIDGINEGKIKGLWVIATNPAHSWINQNDFKQAAKKLEFLVVQDMYQENETSKYAHLILASACWGEKEGTVINSERRLGLFKKVSSAPGQALPDFYIFKLIAKYWGCESLFSKINNPEDAFQAMKELSKNQPCDFTGIENYKSIDAAGGIQWPFPKTESSNLSFDQTSNPHSNFISNSNPDRERRLFADGKFFHPDGKAKFLFDAPRPVAEPTSFEFPFIHRPDADLPRSGPPTPEPKKVQFFENSILPTHSLKLIPKMPGNSTSLLGIGYQFAQNEVLPKQKQPSLLPSIAAKFLWPCMIQKSINSPSHPTIPTRVNLLTITVRSA